MKHAHRFQSRRRRRRLNGRKVGSQLESLEQRRLMAADLAIVADFVGGPTDYHIGRIDPPGGGGEQHDSPECIDFEDLPPAAVYNVGDSFVADNTGLRATFVGRPFEWSDGTSFAGGNASVQHTNLAAGAGQEIGTNNILLDVNFEHPVENLSMNFGEYGGNLNLMINGDHRNFENFADIHGLLIGGTTVTVSNGLGNDSGVLEVDGVVNRFAFGGQELWVDQICAKPSATEFRLDWGDAPDSPYRTLAVNSGAHHYIDHEFYLGDRVDGEADGQPSVFADRDDSTTTDDEDGVTFLTPLVPGQMAEVEVVASLDGWLNAWTDFNQNGVWENGAENIFSSQLLIQGSNILSFMVPADAVPGERTYSRWRFSSTHMHLEPWQAASAQTPNGEVEDHLVGIEHAPEAKLDWGDAPDQPYPTLAINNGARHVVNPDVFLGMRIDTELDGQPNGTSTGDDASSIDDEDGVKFLTPLVPGEMAKVEVTASTDGFLNAWIDTDQDGNWTGAFDKIFHAEPLVPGANVLSFLVPNTAQVGERAFSRWRFSTTHKELTPEYNPDERIPDGEVEDYRGHIVEGDPDAKFDWGDAPDPQYPTLAASLGARHRIDPNVFLGRTVDAEPNGQPSINAQRDDINGGMDDEDGVQFLTSLVPGNVAQVQVIASTDGWLNAWTDFDRDGVWSNGAENIFSAQFVSAGVNVLNFVVPAGTIPASNEPTYSRWRFSTTDKVLEPHQDRDYAPNGEVEDHLAFIDPPARAEYDFGDAPDEPYPTRLASNGARHLIDPDVFLGRTVDGEPDGQPSNAAQRDDANGIMDDEDGVKFLTPIVPGGIAQVEVIASTDGWLNAWSDFDRDGVWSNGAENIFSGQFLTAGSNILSFNVPVGTKPAPNDPIYTRWRFSTTEDVLTPDQPAGHAPNGEVEDHIAFVHPREDDQRWDFGDAPDRPYPTRLARDGARHLINPDVFMGQRIDGEPNGQPSFTAMGDDFSVVDDEDGVLFATPIVPGTDGKVQVEVSVDGHLDAWIDMNQNGLWEPHEQIAVSEFMVAGFNSVEFVVPDDAVPYPLRPVYSRFRFSLNGGLDPDGPAKDGEVEDYAMLNGDLNHDWTIDDQDIDRLCILIHNGVSDGDINNDGAVDSKDMDYLVQVILGTNYGDANLDGKVNSDDLVHMFIGGRYQDGVEDNAGWTHGDFNCDQDFDHQDLVKMFATGAYQSGAPSVGLAAALADESGEPASADESPSEAAESNDPSSDRNGPRRVLLAQATDAIFGDEPDGADDESSSSEEAADEFFALI